MNDNVKCRECGELRPSDEFICGSCGADLYPSDVSSKLTKAQFRTSLSPVNTNKKNDSLPQIEKYSSINVIKYIRRPMNSWLAIGTDYYNMYFTDDKLVIARVYSGRLGLLGALIGLPFYFIVFVLTMKIGNWLDENQGTTKCDQMESQLDKIMSLPAKYKLKTYNYGERVVFENNDNCNSGKMKHKISVEGEEYYFDDFEMDLAKEKLRKHFDVIQATVN